MVEQFVGTASSAERLGGERGRDGERSAMERGLALKSTSPFRIRVSVDAIQRYWPPGAIPQCTIVTALDSTLNLDALARCTGKALGTFESHFLFGQASSSAQVTMQSSSAQVTIQSQNRKRAPAWTEREVLDLIAVWGEESVLAELRSKRRNVKTFQKISEAMRDRGYIRDATQCRVKLKLTRKPKNQTDAPGQSPRHAASTLSCIQF
ncbi:hypothetical protein UY3_09836 [Chelonia mydas]|uniref:Myb/SANT-like DNA-binding domain-containing protein n=1 Tax=Chelonia mydas TaxID=8469 RepID=M7BLX5_CHEMY|nr:hypothetical protein UY3_09836 [Chelonia mydas]